MISKRICGIRDELETEKQSRDETMGIALTYRDEGTQAKAERDEVRQQLDLRNSFDEEMGEGEPAPAASTTRIDTGTFGRPSDFREVDVPMSDAVAAAAAPATIPFNNTGTFGRPSYPPQPAIPMSGAAPTATTATTTPISTGTFGRPSYPVPVDTPMSDVATKPTVHSSNQDNNRQYFKITQPDYLRGSNGGRTVNQQQDSVSRLLKPDILMPDASKHTTDPSTHLSGFTAPPPTGPRLGGFSRGQQQQQSSQANTQPQGDVAMTDDVKANVDHTDGGCFGFPPPAPPSGPRSGSSGHDGREQRPSSDKFPEFDTPMTEATGSGGYGNSPLPRSTPPSGPRVSEFGNRSGKGEGDHSSRAAELDKPMPDATESGSRGNGSLPSSGTSGQAPQLGVGSRDLENQRRIDNETRKLNQRLDKITATSTGSSTEWRWNRYRT